jgi:hypothetical protein
MIQVIPEMKKKEIKGVADSLTTGNEGRSAKSLGFCVCVCFFFFFIFFFPLL